MSQRGNEHYSKKAKKEGYLARSAYKLMELDEKYDLVSGSETILDIGCAPGSWLQYIVKRKELLQKDTYKNKSDSVDPGSMYAGKKTHVSENKMTTNDDLTNSNNELIAIGDGEYGLEQKKVIGLDLKKVEFEWKGVETYSQDIREKESVKCIFDAHGINTFDLIISDMAPDTIGMADIDAIRSIGLIEKTLRIYQDYLSPEGQFVIKIFMGPGYDEFVREMKGLYGKSNIVTYKPKSCRPKSKEIYVIKRF